MQRLKNLVRRALAFGLYYSGLLWLLAARRLRGRAVVLMFHRVLPAGADTYSHAGILVRPGTFAMQMAFLRRHFRVLSPDEFAADLARGAFRPRACLVTFDDGWHDNCEYALPVLAAHRVPAVIFVATAFVGTAETFWQERLARRLHAAARSPDVADGILRELGAADLPGLADGPAKLRIREIVTALKSQDPTVATGLLRRLEQAFAAAGIALPGPGEDRFLDWSQIGRLTQSGLVTIGSHGHTHTPLPLLDHSAVVGELQRSLQELGAHGIGSSAVCAYPNGDVNDTVAAAAREAGIRLGFAVGYGHVSAGDDPLRLRRINVHEDSAATRAEFLCRMIGLF